MRRVRSWLPRLLGGRFDPEVAPRLNERLDRLEPPLSWLVALGGPLIAHIPWLSGRIGAVRDLSRFLLASAELAHPDRELAPTRVVGDPVTSRGDALIPLRIHYQVLVVGSGTGGAIAAASAAKAGRSVLIVEEGPAIAAGQHAPHSAAQSLEQLRSGGSSLVLGRPMSLIAEGRTLGGGSEVNSGFYHRLEGERRSRWISVAGSNEEEWLALECELETRLSVSEAPVRTERHPLEIGAIARSLPVERARVWSKSERGFPEHQGALRTYLADAQAAGARILSLSRVESFTTGPSGIRVSIRLASGERREIVTDELVLAGGAIETPRLLVRSGAARPSELRFSLAPMLRVIAEVGYPVAHGHLPEPVVARSADGRYKFATAAGTRPFLRATLRALGVDPETLRTPLEQLLVCYASFVPEGTGGFRALGGQLTPRMRWSEGDRLDMRRASEELRVTLAAGGAQRLWPAVGQSGVSSVHIGASLPIGGGLLDRDGRLISDLRIRVSDASAMPELPWVNPGGPLSVLALLLARRAEARAARCRSIL